MQVYCTRPGCPQPHNTFPELDNQRVRRKNPQKFCITCGMPIVLRNRYVAERLLGQGGFGAAYLARDLDTPALRQCVIKQFLPNTTEPAQLAKAQELFEREGAVLEELGQHAQIPDLLAFFELDVDNPQTGKQETFFYLVQEFIDGDTLEQELLSQGSFGENQVLQVFRELLPVLQYVHDRGSIHRDIKLSNIMRQHPEKTKFPGQGQLYLLDFGAVKQVSGPGGTKSGAMTGIYTPHYAPPEQSRGEQVFPSSDLYALAVTCIVLLTGKAPDQLFEAYHNRWNWRSQAAVSDRLADILDKMLHATPSQRFQSANEVLQALAAPTTTSSVPQAPSPPPTPTNSPTVQQPAGTVAPPTTTPRPQPVKPAKPPRVRTPPPPLPIARLLSAAAFTGFEMAALGLVLRGLILEWSLSLSVGAGILGMIFALLVFLQFKGIVEKWEQLAIAIVTGLVIVYVPLLQAGLGGMMALLVCGLGGLITLVIGNIFLVIYTLLSRLF
ncbi:protein kinase [Candidatus Synechococcus calcipolaris G9]|uniref:non-specific serine/threonine protein kinase n=1 Tax=Candidatus Synechococcus calcipolaris G9 TaxID=1497997 RepID=A0ABT6EYG3_9SYNE|nr:protein kinase [Candidatus Synechococcus calcipolaris]MDG2990276.1 protein kinase [Candidatus Synechococcus calcipolaris G9]